MRENTWLEALDGAWGKAPGLVTGPMPRGICGDSPDPELGPPVVPFDPFLGKGFSY